MIAQWNCDYISSDKGAVTKKFFPTVFERLKSKDLLLNFKVTQFLSGHGKFNVYLEPFKLTSPNLCNCNLGIQQSVFHLLFDCPL
ncbi:hypothetical protein X975_08205, partial [Stegodyphus mimosarum]